MKLWLIVFAGLAVLIGAGCSRQQRGLPRVAIEVESPDGRFVAQVRNHPALDPPDQSLWLGRPGEAPRLLRRLGGDMDWCDTVAWSADGSTVAFVVRGARLLAVDAATAETVFDEVVVEWHGEYPPAIAVRGLAIDRTGSRASYRGCRRRGGCSETRSVALRPTAETGPRAGRGH